MKTGKILAGFRKMNGTIRQLDIIEQEVNIK